MIDQMRKTALACAVLALAIPVERAGASVYSGCAYGSVSTFKVCASSDVWYNSGTLFMNVINLNQSADYNLDDYASDTGGWHTITAIGLSNLTGYTVGGSGLSLELWYGDDPASLTRIDPTYWKVDAQTLQIYNTATSTDGHKQGLVGALDPGPNSAGHLQTTNGRYAHFRISGFTDLSLGDLAMFEWHSVQVAYPTEQECIDAKTREGGKVENCYNGGYLTENSLKGSTPPTEVVPEPISMVLLGSGLLGVGAVRRRRRRDDLLE